MYFFPFSLSLTHTQIDTHTAHFTSTWQVLHAYHLIKTSRFSSTLRELNFQTPFRQSNMQVLL